MAYERRFLAVPFVMLTDDELSETMGVASWGWSISIIVVLIGAYFWPLVNKAPSLDSMAEAITLYMIENYTYSGTLGSCSTMGSSVGSCGW